MSRRFLFGCDQAGDGFGLYAHLLHRQTAGLDAAAIVFIVAGDDSPRFQGAADGCLLRCGNLTVAGTTTNENTSIRELGMVHRTNDDDITLRLDPYGVFQRATDAALYKNAAVTTHDIDECQVVLHENVAIVAIEHAQGRIRTHDRQFCQAPLSQDGVAGTLNTCALDTGGVHHGAGPSIPKRS